MNLLNVKISIKYIVNMLIAIHNVLNKKVGMRVSSVNVRPSQLGIGRRKVSLNIVQLDCKTSPNKTPSIR